MGVRMPAPPPDDHPGPASVPPPPPSAPGYLASLRAEQLLLLGAVRELVDTLNKALIELLVEVRETIRETRDE